MSSRGARRGRGGMRGGRGGFSSNPSAPSSSQPEAREPQVRAPLQVILVPFEKLTPKQLNSCKANLLNTVCASLIKEPRFDSATSTVNAITYACKRIAYYDPEFVLKLALYTRDDLGIRSTTNYLVSTAANITACQPHIKRYFKQIIKLPSDWLDVAATFQMLPDRELQGKAIPTSLRKAMVAKFADFDAYQLAKYNKEGTIKRKKRLLKKLIAKHPEKAAEVKTDGKPELIIKHMIKQLHISTPAYNIMCILGKKYPTSAEEFRQKNLPGEFESQRAGSRMKLPVPETWETQLTAKGNKAATWEELIEHKKLPFMAMLRNIRNLIFTGVHPRYHKWVMNKLSNEDTIASSHQFPFRFFSAYEVIPKDINDFKVKLAEQNAAKSKKKQAKKGDAPETEKERRKRERSLITPVNFPNPDLFDNYRKALDTAVKLATMHNVKPIRGSTVVFCDVGEQMKNPCGSAKGLGKISQSHQLAILLGLMCKYVCEDCDFRVFGGTTPDGKCHMSIELTEGTILDNMLVVETQSASMSARSDTSLFPVDYVEGLIKSRQRIDNFIVLSHQLIKASANTEFTQVISKYRQEVNKNMLFVSVDLSGRGTNIEGEDESNPNDIMITGFSDSILRFIAERGDSNQLLYVEHIDEAKKIPKDAKSVSGRPAFLDDLEANSQLEDQVVQTEVVPEADTTSEKTFVPWRTARVFISSTFLDMHGERDLLTRHVFPELRERCHARRIRLYEVDLRWGISEEEAALEKAMESCLEQVDRCRPLFVGLLGRRYGYCPQEYKTSGDPKFDWLKEYPKGRSITELEMHYGALKQPSPGAFFYFRDSAFMKDVPKEYTKHFESESKDAGAKLDELRAKIKRSCSVAEYQGKWGGVVDGKPTVTGLNKLHRRIVDDLWGAILKQFPEPVDNLPSFSPLFVERSNHQFFVEARTNGFVGRKEMLDRLTKFCLGTLTISAPAIHDHGTGMVTVVGPAGSGKSSLLAAFSNMLPSKSGKTPAFVVSHFVGCSPSSTSVRSMLHRICSELVRRFRLGVAVSEDYEELKVAFPDILKQAAFQGRVVLIIDGVNQLDPANRALSLDWLPSSTPVKIILSTTDDAANPTLAALRRRKPAPPELVVEPLDLKDRKDIVRKILLSYHKRLDERPTNDQMRLLIKKTDAANPLYLLLACEELRIFGVFEMLSDRIKSLSSSLPKLLDEILLRLENDHGRELVATALSSIASARRGLLESELQVLLRRRGEQTLPQAIWARLYRSLQVFMVPSEQSKDNALQFFHNQMQVAVSKRYLEAGTTALKIHRTLAEHYHAQADPKNDQSWSGSERALGELPHHLVRAKMYKEAEAVLCDLRFVERKCESGLTFDLVADYIDATSERHASGYQAGGLARIQNFWTFVSSNAHILAEQPHLVFQQASNQPDASAPSIVAASSWSNRLVKSSWFQWINKPQLSDSCKMTISSFADPVLSIVYSPDGKKIAVPSRDCTVRIFDAATGVEENVLSGHSNWVVACAFSGDGSTLVTASWDTTLKLWDVVTGASILTLSGHKRAVNCVQFAPDGKTVLSGSWDCTMRTWDSITGRYLKIFHGHTKPINACCYSLDGKKVASASWDRSICIWDSYEATQLVSMTGHLGSIRTCQFSPNGRQLVSGSVDRSINLWDVSSGKKVAIMGTHSKPVTSCSYARDGQTLATSSEDCTIKVWAGVLGKQLSSARISSGWMNCVTFSPDESRIATGTSDCFVKIWDASSLQEIRSMMGHTRAVTAVAFSPADNGRILASSSDDFSVCIWDSQDGTLKHTLKGHNGCVNSISFSVDGARLATASDDFKVLIWSVADGKLLTELSGHGNIVRSVAFSPSGKYIASAGRDCVIRIWQADSGKLLSQLSGHLDWINAIAFSHDSKRLVSCAWDFNLKVWNVRLAKEVCTMKGHGASVEACQFTGDNSMVVSCSYDNTIRAWDAQTGSEITALSGHDKRVNSIAVSKVGLKVASVSDDASLRIWDGMAGTNITTLIGHAAPVTACSFSPETSALVSSSEDRTVKTWDTQQSGFAFSGHTAWVNGCSFSRAGTSLASVSDDGSVKIWSTTSGECTITIQPNQGTIRCVQFTQSDSVVVGFDDGRVAVYTNGKLDVAFAAHSKAVRSCDVSGNVIATASWDCKVALHDISGSPISVLTEHSDWVEVCKFSKDGEHLATGGRDNRIVLWRRSGSSYTSYRSLVQHSGWITSLGFSDDGRKLVSGSFDNNVIVWDLRDADQQITLSAHTGPVTGCAFAANASKVLSTSMDGKLYLWDIKQQKVLSEFVHAGPCTTFSFGESAKLLASGDSIGNIYLLKYHSQQA